MNTIEKIKIPGVKNIIVVASGKGGVGKSTVSVNLSISLAQKGLKVALVDADIFGPSIPKMFGIEDTNAEVATINNKEMIFPIEKYGVKIMSIGFFVKKNQGLIWRGPMASNVITQLFENTIWGDIDYMIVDFPPGTSDIQLTVVQKLQITGAIIVTTPQEVALNDARKAASMFVNKDLNVPILGVIENMSFFVPNKHPDEQYLIFGEGGGEKLSLELNTKLLAKIPLIMEIGKSAEEGKNIFTQNDKRITKEFEKITESIIVKKNI